MTPERAVGVRSYHRAHCVHACTGSWGTAVNREEPVTGAGRLEGQADKVGRECTRRARRWEEDTTSDVWILAMGRSAVCLGGRACQ